VGQASSLSLFAVYDRQDAYPTVVLGEANKRAHPTFARRFQEDGLLHRRRRVSRQQPAIQMQHIDRLAYRRALGHNQTMPTKSSSSQRGYPLIALFLVITGCGIIAALVGPAMRGIFAGSVGPGDAAYTSTASAILIMTLGGIVGMFHYHRGRGFFWGLVTGSAIGIFVGPMMMTPRGSLNAMLGLSVGGTAVILLVTTAFRLAARRT
jgi:hypothetical protein